MALAAHFKLPVMLRIATNCGTGEKRNEYPTQGRHLEVIVQPVRPIHS